VLLRTVYTVIPGGRADVPDLDLPLTVDLAAEVWATPEQENGALRFLVDRRVDRDALEVVTRTGVFREDPNGSARNCRRCGSATTSLLTTFSLSTS
jgi:hypothetical protein